MTKEKPTEKKWPALDSYFRWRDLADRDISFNDLQQLIKSGDVERVARGLYWPVNAEPTEYHTIAGICALVPNAIVCLLSALSIHELGTQLPREVWIAIPHKARAPRITEFPVRIVRFSGPSLNYGIDRMQLEGIPARVTSPARTVVDCFRFRRLVGRDVALEALRESLRERKATVDEIWRTAEVCRAKSLVGPYLEAMAV